MNYYHTVRANICLFQWNDVVFLIGGTDIWLERESVHGFIMKQDNNESKKLGLGCGINR